VTQNKPMLPVMDVDQAFPLLTTDGAGGRGQAAGAVDQGPAVAAAIRDVLGWRPRAADTKAFNAALTASFDLKQVEGHVEATYRPRGYAIQADLGGITGGQASLYTRASAAHTQINRLMDALKPLRPDADPEDCDAFRLLIRDSVRQIVAELGQPGGPRVQLVDAAFATLTGYLPGGGQAFTSGPPVGTGTGSTGVAGGGGGRVAGPPRSWPGSPGGTPSSPLIQVPLAPSGTTADDVTGQLGAMRERFGLTNDNVNTVEEEKIRTSFWTLVDLIQDLQRSWDAQRLEFGSDAGRGFLGTELVLINRLLAAAAEQVDELESVLDSVLISGAERQTLILDDRFRLTLDGLLGWLRTFLTEDGPRILTDAGRDGLTASFTPTVAALRSVVRDKLVARLVPCGSCSCAGGSCGCRAKGAVSYLPIGCCTPLPPGMYAARIKIAVAGLCGLLERLTRTAARLGRFSGILLFDVLVLPVNESAQVGQPEFVRVEVRGLNLRPTQVPAFVVSGTGSQLQDLVLPLHGSSSVDDDSLVAVFARDSLPDPIRTGRAGVFAAAELPLAVVDGETGQPITTPPVLSWPDFQPAFQSDPTQGPGSWAANPDLAQDQRFPSVGRPVASTTDPLEDEPCTEPCAEGCGSECACGCHLRTVQRMLRRLVTVAESPSVQQSGTALADSFKEIKSAPAEVAQVVETLRAFLVAAGRAESPLRATLQALLDFLQDLVQPDPANDGSGFPRPGGRSIRPQDRSSARATTGSVPAAGPGGGPVPGSGPASGGGPASGSGPVSGGGPVPGSGPVPGAGPAPGAGPEQPGSGVGTGVRHSLDEMSARIGAMEAMIRDVSDRITALGGPVAEPSRRTRARARTEPEPKPRAARKRTSQQTKAEGE